MSDLAPYIGVDLSLLPPPEMIQEQDFSTIFTAEVADLVNRDPTYTILLESDPAIKLLEVAAYREELLRQNFNDRAEQLLLAFATGTNLEALAARVGLQREIVIPANPNVYPPVVAVYDTDDALRQRVQLAAENYNTAGSPGAYLFHTRSASAAVFDARIYNYSSKLVKLGQVLVCIMVADGVDPSGVVAAVRTRLFRDDVKPITDDVRITVAKPENYSVNATVFIRNGPSLALVRSTLTARLATYLKAQKRINTVVATAGIIAALKTDYVERVTLANPTADFFPSLTGYGVPSSVNVRIVTLA